MPSGLSVSLPRRTPSAARMCFFCMLCFFVAFLLKNPALLLARGESALRLCATRMVPSLFPFFVVTGLLLRCGYAGSAGRLFGAPVRALFGMRPACAAPVLLGMGAGFPVGAECALSLYRRGECSRTECERLLAFCNNCSPAFLVGMVGAGLFGSPRAGWILVLAQALAALTVGVLFRVPKRLREASAADAGQAAKPPSEPIPQALAASVAQAALSTLTVCGFVLFFALVVTALAEGLLACGANLFVCTLVGGLTEFTTGVSTAAAVYGTARPLLALILTGGFVGAGGCSVLLQVLALSAGTDVSLRRCFCGKLLQGGLSAGFAAAGAMLLGGI